jgi:hypothetical protein
MAFAKGRVENGVGYVKKNFLTGICGSINPPDARKVKRERQP